METNELPEEVTRQIDNEAGKQEEWYGFTMGAEFGYRLALQSKEEEVTARTMELELRYAQIEHMKEQLKAKDEALRTIRIILRSEDVGKVYTACDKIDSILSQSTDKPNE